MFVQILCSIVTNLVAPLHLKIKNRIYEKCVVSFPKGKTKRGETLLLMQTSWISEALFQIMFTFGGRAFSINPGIRHLKHIVICNLNCIWFKMARCRIRPVQTGFFIQIQPFDDI